MKTGQCCSPSRPSYEAISTISMDSAFVKNLWRLTAASCGYRGSPPDFQKQLVWETWLHLKLGEMISRRSTENSNHRIGHLATCLVAIHLKKIFLRKSLFCSQLFAKHNQVTLSFTSSKSFCSKWNISDIFSHDLKIDILLLCYTRIVLHLGSRLSDTIDKHVIFKIDKKLSSGFIVWGKLRGRPHLLFRSLRQWWPRSSQVKDTKATLHVKILY